MPKLSKRVRENTKLMLSAPVEAAEAIKTLRTFKAPKFDQTVNVVMHLGLDTKQADQAIRGSVSLPRGIGKAKRVVAFCPSDQVKEALEAGAVKAGGEDLVDEIEKGFFDFDVAVSTPDMMRVISKLGRVLGPKGLMPSPKAGSVTKDVIGAVREFAAGKLEYRADKGGNVHGILGKMSFDDDALLENLNHFIATIEKAKPSTVKGTYVKKITVSGTMTPGVQIAVAAAADE
ncbi:MAG: 50S ribosomal protein L1 [Phycisphaeraceae bacterium]|nr:50S ribosomal protein L1 [Phycisphaerales bacterium]MCB9860777.1 50S ribosomal protein L1 [Phycisphaeraceae bacterium]